VAAGQPLGDLPTHISRAAEVVRGYPTAMALEQPGNLWHTLLAIPLAGLLAVQTWHAVRDLGLRIQAGTVLALSIGLWIAFREGFVRHDGHAGYFFQSVVVLGGGMLLAGAPRIMRMAIVATVIAGYLATSMISMPFLSPVDRQTSLGAMAQTLSAGTSLSYAKALLARHALDLTAHYRITPDLVTALGSGETLVDPWDISALAATNARWRPLPSVQLYAAYTPELDAINTADLAARPRQVLRSVPYGAIDGRFAYWESPRYQRALYCGYEVVFETASWQVLRPSTRSRCGAAEGAVAVDAEAGQAVSVPRRAGAMTLVTIIPRPDPVHALLGLVFKPPEQYVTHGARYRLAQSPVAVDLPLNGPVAHRAFAGLNREPAATISASYAARFEFQLVAVDARPATGQVGTVSSP
jgi:hypothetical protein